MIAIGLALLFQVGLGIMPEFLRDDTSVLIAWKWQRGTGPDANGFRLYCGDFDNADATYHYFTEMIEIPDKLARGYLMLPMSSRFITDATPKMRIRCTVQAYNTIGESDSGLAGVPAEPTDVQFVRQLK